MFDFDGLIIDSEWVIYESARAAFAVHGHDLTVDAWATIVGLGDDDDELMWATLVGAMGIEGFEMATFGPTYREQDRSDRDSLPLLPGVEVLVDSLVAAGRADRGRLVVLGRLARAPPRTARSAASVRHARRRRRRGRRRQAGARRLPARLR